ncbi:unnamed protein product, partial [Ixodes hexagonus]
MSRQLYWKFVRYLDSYPAAVPPVDDLLEMVTTFGAHARKDEAALQGKFKNWARRITLVSDSTLMLGNRVVVPRDRYADIAWTFHTADPQRHLTISEVRSTKEYDTSLMGLPVILLRADNCGGRVSGVKFPPAWLEESVQALAWAIRNRVRLNPLATNVELRLLDPAIRVAPRSGTSELMRLPPASAQGPGCPSSGRVSLPRVWLPCTVHRNVRLNSRGKWISARRSAAVHYYNRDGPPFNPRCGSSKAERLAQLLERLLRDRNSLPRILRIIDAL